MSQSDPTPPALPDEPASLTGLAPVLPVRDLAAALLAEWRSAGVSGRFFAPQNTDYGLREAAHIDRDGNLIRFGSRLRRGAAHGPSG